MQRALHEEGGVGRPRVGEAAADAESDDSDDFGRGRRERRRQGGQAEEDEAAREPRQAHAVEARGPRAARLVHDRRARRVHVQPAAHGGRREPRPLAWCVREVWLLLDEKDIAEAQDEREGQPAQPVTDFVLEAFLKRHGTREQAEHALFTLVRSVKEHRRHHPLVHTFARALGLLVEKAEHREGEKPRKADEKITDHIKITNSPPSPCSSRRTSSRGACCAARAAGGGRGAAR